MSRCEKCLMSWDGLCLDLDSDYYGGPVPDTPCSLFEDAPNMSLFGGDEDEAGGQVPGADTRGTRGGAA